MSRTKLQNRRPSITRKVPFTLTNGHMVTLLVTLGFDERQKVREVFCADFKAGSDQHAVVMDACILLSRLFQHGYSAADIAATLSEASLIKTIAMAAAEEDAT